MIAPEQIPELPALYRAEEALPVKRNDTFASLVVPTGQQRYPLHDWFKYKEAFAADFLPTLLNSLPRPIGKSFRLLDPFCGVGTSLVSAQLLAADGFAIESIGIDCNPLATFVASTKVRWPEIDPGLLLKIGERAVEETKERAQIALPRLSSITTGRCISRHHAARIVRIREAIAANSPTASRDACLLGLAASVEPISKVRRDGRALRIVVKDRRELARELERRCSDIATDCALLQELGLSAPQPSVVLGDGRNASAFIEKEPVDLIVTSPPYPNNIDYNEVYKLELWLLGFTTDSKSFLALRRGTFRSHPTCLDVNAEADTAELASLLALPALKRAVSPLVFRLDEHPERWRRKVLRGYLLDCWRMLADHFKCLRPGGYAAYVVGNSLHGSADGAYVIPTDITLAMMGREHGFEAISVIVARGLRRRLATNHFLRESVVVLRKPSAQCPN